MFEYRVLEFCSSSEQPVGSWSLTKSVTRPAATMGMSSAAAKGTQLFLRMTQRLRKSTPAWRTKPMRLPDNSSRPLPAGAAAAGAAPSSAPSSAGPAGGDGFSSTPPASASLLTSSASCRKTSSMVGPEKP